MRFILFISLFGAVCALDSAAQSTRPGLGSLPYADASGTGVTFRVWAPNATNVSVKGQFSGWASRNLVKETNGCWSVDVAGAQVGQEYKYTVNRRTDRRDPRSRRVVNSAGNSIIYDPAAFDWGATDQVHPSFKDLVIYELHAGTFNAGTNLPGTFDQCIERLDHVQGLGVTAIEVMPPFEYPNNQSWGYNPADLFAIESTLGGADAFKRFVKACHQRGLAVLVDVVHNHHGPSDLSLWQWDLWKQNNLGGIYYYNTSAKAATMWGNTRPDFGRPEVRQFIRDNIFMLTDEYRCDGFRWDSVFSMLYYNSGANSIPEANQMLNAINTELATNRPGTIRIAEDHGFDFAMNFQSQWESSFQQHLQWQIAQSADSNRNMGWLADHIATGSGLQRVIYSESHDSTGDLNSGWRMPAAADSANPTSIWARKRQLLAASIVMTTPGVPQLFQGQEMNETLAFSSGTALRWSLTNTWSGIVQAYKDLIQVRRNLRGGTQGLKGSGVNVHWRDDTSKVISYVRWDQGGQVDDVVVVANFSVKTWTNSNYVLEFPSAGTWYAHFNGDATNYGADFGNIGSAVVLATGTPARAGINLGRYAAQIFSKSPPVPPGIVTLDPASPTGCTTVAVAYNAANGPLAGVTGIVAAVGRNNWATSYDLPLVNSSGSVWTATLVLPADTAQLDLAFHDGAVSNRVWDNNLGADWRAPVAPCAMLPAEAIVSPDQPQGCAPAVFRYEARSGPLAGATNVVLHLGRNNWQFTQDVPMAALAAGVWGVTNEVPPGTWQLDFAFHDGAASNRIWDNHAGADWHATVLPCPVPPAPVLAVTSPPSDLVVADTTLSMPLSGSCSSGIVGQLVWSNDLTGAWGVLAAADAWTIASLPLGEGVNVITITGTNDTTNPNAGARDAATNALYVAAGVWTNGQHGGSGWGGGWSLAGGASAGQFLADTNTGNLRIGSRAWGLWANSGALASATRPLAAPLQAGDTLSLKFQNNWIENGASAGFGLQNRYGQTLFEFYFAGGGTNYLITDATNARPTGVSWTDQGMSLQFTLTAADAFSLTVGAATITGQLAATSETLIGALRCWNNAAGAGGNYNVYFTDLAIDGPPLPTAIYQDQLTITRRPSPDSDSDLDGFLNWEEELAGTDPFNAESHLPDIGPIAGNQIVQIPIASTAAARWYDVFFTTNLADQAWQRYGLDVQGSGNPVTLTITNGTGTIFYRTGVYQP